MKVGSLFAGIGGFDLGFERAGYEITWQVEIDPYCLKVLEKNFQGIVRFEAFSLLVNRFTRVFFCDLLFRASVRHARR